MTPDELAKANTEHSHQRALFAWANMAARHGFAAAWDDRSYKEQGFAETTYGLAGVVVLRFLFAIPNGGLRDKATAGKLKAEGVKDGVPDTMLPVPRHMWAGLFIEMKRPGTVKKAARAFKDGRNVVDQRAGATSAVQDEWIAYLRHAGYGVSVVFEWREAAKQVQSYLEWTP
jgi:hypothetical protein